MAKKFKWVRINNKYGVKNWKDYELFIEGRSKRVALIEKLPGSNNYYSAIVDFNADGYNGKFFGYNKSTGTIRTFAYLKDCKAAVERYYGLRK